MAESEQNGERDFNDYFYELDDIEQGTRSIDSVEEELSKTPDEGEQEVAWLKDAGYGHLVSKIEVGEEIDEETVAKETKSLTEIQAAAVKKRIDTLNATFKKNKKQRRTDVRDIFDLQPDKDNPAIIKSEHETNLTKTPSIRARPERRKNRLHRSPFLRHRGEYSMNGNSSAIVDGMVSRGISMLYVHPTDDDVFISDSTSPRSIGTKIVNGFQSTCTVGHHLTLTEGQQDCTEISPLPDLAAIEDGLGITHVEDLSKKDLERVQPLALIELTAIFDEQGITYIRRRARGRYRDVGLFGVSLSVLLEQDRKKHPNLTVPLIFQELIRHLSSSGLNEEGILRVPGAVNRIKSLRQDLELLYKRGKLSLAGVGPHDAAALLKQFLRELPIPLLTHDYMEAFRQVEKIEELRRRVEALNFLVLLLPTVHRNVLQMLLTFLNDVISVDANKMTLSNVAMIIAPNLFYISSSWPQNITSARRLPKSGKDILEVSKAAETSNVVQLLIHYQDLLWRVPPFILSQVRKQYQHESMRHRDSKPFMKLLGIKDKPELRKKTSSASEVINTSKMIRVNAPQLSKFNATIQLDQRLTAADVLARFSSSPELARSRDSGTWESSSGDELDSGNSSASPSTSTQSIHLYEVGGNIGERRLDLGTNILSLYRVNPNAEFIVRINSQVEPTSL